MREIVFARAVERFRGDVVAVLGRDFTTEDVLAVAVSGGPDSMALLALAHAAWPGQVIAATVDHGLRAAAADEAAMVAGWCETLATSSHPGRVLGSTPPRTQRLEDDRPGGPRNKSGVTMAEGVPHAILHPPEPLGTANIQASARAARYALLTDWAIAHGATMLATAHHADDQAETFLMRAARGSGLAGLSGIRPIRRLGAIPLIRPLLDWRRRDLRALVDAGGIPFVDDPSNADAHYDRTRFRRLLAENEALDPVRLAETARFAREGHEALDAMIDWLWRERQTAPNGEDQTWLDFADLPREIRRRLSREAISLTRNVNGIVRPAFSADTNIEPLLDAVTAGTPATHAGILVSRSGDIWHFRAAPPRRNTPPPQS